MTLQIVNTITLRPERSSEFRELVGQLAIRARSQGDPIRWHAYRTLYGRVKRVHLAGQAERFGDLKGRGDVEMLWQRVRGAQAGAEQFARVAGCIEEVEPTIAIERPDLSHPPEPPVGEANYAFVTVARVRSGGSEAFEAMLQQLAEAARHAGDRSRVQSYQIVFGGFSTYYSVWPLSDLGDLDEQIATPELLARAHGEARGREIWRLGNQAVASGRRSILIHSPELSNAWD